MTTTSVSGARVLDRVEALARHSEQADGLTRVFLSPELRGASDLVLGWMREAGMAARVDPMGNVVGRYEGREAGLPCLMLGSHLDTVRDAGKYDGMLGVVAAIECVHALHARGKRLPFAVEVVGFGDEEGVRFGATLLGSRAVAGTLDPRVLDLADKDGIGLRRALTDYGLDPNRITDAARRREEILAYAELHIEQGPVLEAEGLPAGVVTAINGATRLAVTIDGTAGHAGTVPMSLRRDALAAAAECVLAIEQRAVRAPELVATVGRLEARPGAVNVIPGSARFTVDVRSPRDADRIAAVGDVKQAIGEICARRRVRAVVAQLHESKTAPCAAWVMAQLARAVAAEGIRVRELPSGAGHDGMAMIDIADIGMAFVRCKGGISHNPAESVTAADAETGARVLLRFIESFEPPAGGGAR
jgi:allantoate deiminase